jgi:hypothetical protein
VARQVDHDEDAGRELAAKLLGKEDEGFDTPRGCPDSNNVSVGHALRRGADCQGETTREPGWFPRAIGLRRHGSQALGSQLAKQRHFGYVLAGTFGRGVASWRAIMRTRESP